MDFISKLGGRKFILGILSILILTVLAVVKPEAIKVELITGLLGILGLFNASNAFTTAKTAGLPPNPSAPNIDTEVYQKQLDDTRLQLNNLTDIILKLTAPPQPANMIVQQPTNQGVQANAQLNRDAIKQYLSNNFSG